MMSAKNYIIYMMKITLCKRRELNVKVLGSCQATDVVAELETQQCLYAEPKTKILFAEGVPGPLHMDIP